MPLKKKIIIVKNKFLHISVIKLSLNHVEVKSLGLIMRRQVLPVIISERGAPTQALVDMYGMKMVYL